MKTHKVLFLALIVSAVLAVSVEAGDRHGNNGRSQVAPSRGRSSGQSFSSGSGFRSGGSRTIGSSQHFSSMGVRSTPMSSFHQRSTTFNSGGNTGSFSERRFTPGTFNRTNGVARFQNNGNLAAIQGNRVNRFSALGNSNRGLNSTGAGNRFTRFGNNNRGFNRTGGSSHVFSRRSADWHRDWDRRSDHWWNGHRCRFANGSWFIFDFGFVPWYGWSYYDSYPYDYYPYGYGGYGYGAYGYDPGVYDQSNYYGQGGYNDNGQSNYYDQGDSKSYDQSANGLGSNEQSAANVADVQDQLTRAGYCHRKIDGVLGPETRHALVRYQSDKGLRMTGSLTIETQQSLGLAQGAEN
jgi:hypothetical protein